MELELDMERKELTPKDLVTPQWRCVICWTSHQPQCPTAYTSSDLTPIQAKGHVPFTTKEVLT
eukprot:4873508-Amphidinium_carterae.1